VFDTGAPSLCEIERPSLGNAHGARMRVAALNFHRFGR
jgi:hypothetical protein